jgi:hypothetical protein
VPKASVHEDTNLRLSEYEIRFAEQLLLSAPTRYPVGSKYLNELQLSRLVATGPDPAHQLGSGGRIKDVDHQTGDNALRRPTRGTILGN